MILKKPKVKEDKFVISSPIGKLGLTIVDGRLVRLRFLSPSTRVRLPVTSKESRQIIQQIKQYFCNPRLCFTLPIQPEGTPLQQKIWKALQSTPCGQTITYGQLAQKIGTGPRVIGNACRRNPILLVIPCHRVVAASGLGGYCGNNFKNALKIKKWLLQHESK